MSVSWLTQWSNTQQCTSSVLDQLDISISTLLLTNIGCHKKCYIGVMLNHLINTFYNYEQRHKNHCHIIVKNLLSRKHDQLDVIPKSLYSSSWMFYSQILREEVWFCPRVLMDLLPQDTCQTTLWSLSYSSMLPRKQTKNPASWKSPIFWGWC